ncbi:MAG: DUF2281 domain-containing protein [Armatimonadetes bacterium]|nr:DUF2281 domain-containing protein [Armatimonadota bacterium]
MSSIEEKIKSLPREAQDEVEDFVDFLARKHTRKSARRLRLDWRGALKDMRDQYTSVELQHKALDWWGD